ncbi:hypothetical protein BGX29_007686 [Mortierella sp. GBA35]|nr:hypothetical protein BGX29_007686 [Mortierella sp. GBA35]
MGLEYGKEIDVYPFGVIIYQLPTEKGRGQDSHDYKPPGIAPPDVVEAEDSFEVDEFTMADMERCHQGVRALGGDDIYKVPEQKKAHDTKVDVYTFGIILCQLLQGKAPGPEDVPFGDLAGDGMSQRAAKVIRDATRADPEARHTFHALATKYEFFEGFFSKEGRQKRPREGISVGDLPNKRIASSSTTTGTALSSLLPIQPPQNDEYEVEEEEDGNDTDHYADDEYMIEIPDEDNEEKDDDDDQKGEEGVKDEDDDKGSVDLASDDTVATTEPKTKEEASLQRDTAEKEDCTTTDEANPKAEASCQTQSSSFSSPTDMTVSSPAPHTHPHPRPRPSDHLPQSQASEERPL